MANHTLNIAAHHLFSIHPLSNPHDLDDLSQTNQRLLESQPLGRQLCRSLSRVWKGALQQELFESRQRVVWAAAIVSHISCKLVVGRN